MLTRLTLSEVMFECLYEMFPVARSSPSLAPVSLDFTFHIRVIFPSLFC